MAIGPSETAVGVIIHALAGAAALSISKTTELPGWTSVMLNCVAVLCFALAVLTAVLVVYMFLPESWTERITHGKTPKTSN